MIILQEDLIYGLTVEHPGETPTLIAFYADHDRLHQDAARMLAKVQEEAGKEDSPILWLPTYSCAPIKVVQ